VAGLGRTREVLLPRERGQVLELSNIHLATEGSTEPQSEARFK
jgi:hypothetical protein